MIRKAQRIQAETSVYLSPKWANLFASHGLDTFNALWTAPFKEVDEPNKSADGWSSVSLMTLTDDQGDRHNFYIKRQEAYTCRSIRSPFKAIPVFEREFFSIQRFAKLDIPAITPVYFAKRLVASKPQAILITESLDGYLPMDEWLEGREEGQCEQRAQLVVALGKAVATLHGKGLAHRALYAKHVFVKEGGEKVVENSLAYIDLETARPHFGLLKYKLRDLGTLYRRSGLSHSEYRIFLQHYLKQPGWNAQCEKILGLVESKNKK